MGRKTHRSRRPQAPKDPMAQLRANMARASAIELPDKMPGINRDNFSRANGPVYGSGKKKGVTGGQRGSVRPPAVAKVAPYIDESRIRPSASHGGFHGAGKDPNPPRTTFVRSRKGGVSSATVKPHAPADVCPFCWHEEAKLASIGDRPMDPVKLLRHCREHYPALVRDVLTERENHVLADATLKVAWREKVKNHEDELARPTRPASVPPPPSMLDGATREDIDAWHAEHGVAYHEDGDWRKRYSA